MFSKKYVIFEKSTLTIIFTCSCLNIINKSLRSSSCVIIELNLTGKHAKQMSTIGGFNANSPINGMIGPNKCADRGFSHTKDEYNPWWQVNLERNYTVERVKVMTRRKIHYFSCC